MKNNNHTKGEWKAKVNPILGTENLIEIDNICVMKRTDDEAQANAERIVKAVNSHDELFKMVYDLKKCVERLTQDNVTQEERDLEAYWIGEAHELLHKVNPDYYQNANARTTE